MQTKTTVRKPSAIPQKQAAFKKWIQSISVLLDFEAEHWNDSIPSTLFFDQNTDTFYLGKVMAGRAMIEEHVAQMQPEHIRQCTTREALEWFAKNNPYSSGSNGDLEELCQFAAQELKECGR